MYREILARIREQNEVLKAFTVIACDAAADAASQVSSTLPLAGMPIAVKDLIDTADMPTSYGSGVYEGHQPVVDAGVVAALRAAGAFVVGKTTTTEFATWPPTKTLNPRNHAHTPGGSSAGSAAAVAAGLVPAALGTQTKGSVIRPASYCGVVGFKPSYNRFSRAGVKLLSESLDTVGVLTNTVATAERIYVALTHDGPASLTRVPRLAFCRTPQWDQVSAGVQAVFEEGISRLRRSLSIQDIDLPRGFADIPALTNVVHDYEARRSLLPEVLSAPEKMNASLVQAMLDAGRLTGRDNSLALEELQARRLEFASVIDAYDAFLCPATADEAPAGLTSTGNPIMNVMWSALHLPCVTLPVLTGPGGLPVGLQIVGRAHGDMDLLGVASFLEDRCVEAA